MKIIFAERLKDLMKELGLNQTRLARQTGIDMREIGMWVRGERRASYERLWALADYFEVSIDYLLGREND